MYEELLKQRVRGSQIDFSIHHDPAQVMPWSVQYGGGGHYFLTAEEAVTYAQHRKWITANQAFSILEQLADDRIP